MQGRAQGERFLHRTRPGEMNSSVGIVDNRQPITHIQIASAQINNPNIVFTPFRTGGRVYLVVNESSAFGVTRHKPVTLPLYVCHHTPESIDLPWTEVLSPEYTLYK